jgi:hypothetical protein
MTYDELCSALLKVLPRATFDEDLEGQLIIYTDLCLDNGGQLTPHNTEEVTHGMVGNRSNGGR